MITVKEATHFFRSYEVKCVEKLVGEWMDQCQVGRDLRDLKDEIDEWDMYNFSDWCSVYGTAYEDEIDDQTKINRLLKEIDELKKENETLKAEKIALEDSLGILPF
jgi:hypothetical protein